MLCVCVWVGEGVCVCVCVCVCACGRHMTSDSLHRHEGRGSRGRRAAVDCENTIIIGK